MCYQFLPDVRTKIERRTGMIRQEQCDKVCRILDDVLANRPTERDSLIVAVQKAFNALEQAETNCSEIPNNCPAADVVPVVRCDDCVYYGSRRWCELHSSVFDDNAFCSYGERKVGE